MVSPRRFVLVRSKAQELAPKHPHFGIKKDEGGRFRLVAVHLLKVWLWREALGSSLYVGWP